MQLPTVDGLIGTIEMYANVLSVRASSRSFNPWKMIILGYMEQMKGYFKQNTVVYVESPLP